MRPSPVMLPCMTLWSSRTIVGVSIGSLRMVADFGCCHNELPRAGVDDGVGEDVERCGLVESDPGDGVDAGRPRWTGAAMPRCEPLFSHTV